MTTPSKTGDRQCYFNRPNCLHAVSLCFEPGCTAILCERHYRSVICISCNSKYVSEYYVCDKHETYQPMRRCCVICSQRCCSVCGKGDGEMMECDLPECKYKIHENCASFIQCTRRRDKIHSYFRCRWHAEKVGDKCTVCA